MGRVFSWRYGAVLPGLALALSSPAHAQNATAEDVAWAHDALKFALEAADEPLAGKGEWTDGDVKSVSYSGEGCRATLVESYPAAGGAPAQERRFELDWFEDSISFEESNPFDGRFVVWSNQWDTESRELPFYTGDNQIEPRVALNKLREVCSPLARDEHFYGAAQSQIDLLLEDTGFPTFEDGVQTERWGTREVVGTGCETWIEMHYPEGSAQAGSRDWVYVVWNQVAPRIDPRFADFVIIDIGEDPRHLYAGSAEEAQHLKAAMDDLGAQCRARYGEAEASEQPDDAPVSPPPPRLWPRPEPVVGIGWQTNRNDWSCQLYTELGQDRFVLLHYQKAQALYYLWIWDKDRFAGGTRPADDLTASISGVRAKVDLPEPGSAFFHDTRLIAPLGFSGTSAMQSIVDVDQRPTVLVRSQAEGINARYSLPSLALADVREFKACVDPYWTAPGDETSLADDEPIYE